jgi:hypothetical protein
LNEPGLFKPDAIEAQLAHRPRGGAYLRGEFWDKRVRMMEWWSDYLDKLAGYGNVLSLQSDAPYHKDKS